MYYSIDHNRAYSPQERSLPLVHMTSTYETLEKIIKEGLRPSYSKEYLTNGKEIKSAAFPMISLSNITIDEAIYSQKSYGTFGIALRQSWGQENGFNPVLYLERQSDLSDEIISCFQHIKANSIDELNSCLQGVLLGPRHILTKSILKIFAHSKNYDGRLVRKNTLISESFTSGLEREWRKIIIENNIPYFLIEKDFDKIDGLNQRLSLHKCDFKFEEIIRVIVENDDEKEALEKILCEKYLIKSIPKELIQINTMRHMPDEG